MKILLIGGSGFIGPRVARLLLQAGHSVAVLHRGNARTPAGAEEILGDRNQLEASAAEVRRFAPEVVVDVVLSSGEQAQQLMTEMRGVARRVVALSSIDVYRAAGVLHGTEPGPVQA